MQTARFAVWIVLLACAAQAKTNIVTFDDLPLPAGQDYWNGSDMSGGFTTGPGVHFSNSYNAAWSAWSGFSYSRVSDTNTAGFMNQYAAISGAGFGGQGQYLVVWDDQWGIEADVVTFPSPCRVRGLYVNNTTYVALSMLQGDDFSKQFGGASGTDQDWLLLTVTGQDADGKTVGSKLVSLADFRSPLPSADGIVREWTWVDLDVLGDNVRQLRFMLSSSDTGAWGINTPTYFAIDNLVFETPDAPQIEPARPDLAVYSTDIKYSTTGGLAVKTIVGNAGTAACKSWLTVWVTTPKGRTLQQNIKVGRLTAGEKRTVRVFMQPGGKSLVRGTYSLRVVGFSDQSTAEIRLDNNELTRTLKW